eukprot:IDg18268t1
MPHVRGATTLMDTAWANAPLSAISRCWLKSKSLDLAHEHTLRELLPANEALHRLSRNRFTLKKRDRFCVGTRFLAYHQFLKFHSMNSSMTSICMVHLHRCIPAPDEGRLQEGLAASEIQDLFDTRDDEENSS